MQQTELTSSDSAAYRRYLQSLQHAPRTVRSYCDTVAAFMALGLPLSGAGCREYLAQLADKGNGAATQKVKMAAVSALCTWLRLERRLSADELLDIREVRRPKLPRHLPRVLAEEEVQALLDQVAPIPRPRNRWEARVLTALHARDRALCEIAYCGPRAEELQRLSLPDVRLCQDGILLRVRGKGDDDRLVPGGQRAREALGCYLEVRERLRNPRTEYLDPKALFVGSRLGRRLCLSEVARIVRRWGKQVQIDVHPHALRHSFGSHMADHGAPIHILRDLFGHRSTDTTSIYLHTTMARLLEAFKKHHPRA